MDDTPYIHDGADASLRKTVSLLNKIEAKTGSATITGPVTVTNEVEIKNDANHPLPVSDNNGSLTVDGTVELGETSLAALENIQVTFPSTQNVNVTNAGLSVSVSNLPATQLVSGSISVSNFPATQPVSLASVPSHLVTGPLTNTELRAVAVPVSLASAPVTPVTDNGGSLTVDGTITAAQATAANLNATVVGSGSFTAAQSTASNLKAQAQLLNASGSVVDYAMTGTAGTPATDVVTIQGIAGGTNIQVSDKGSTGPTTVTNYTSTTSSVLASANSARKLLTVFNEGVGTLYVLYGAGTASTSNYSVRLNSGDYLEIEKYTGTVTGVFGTAGTARVTEIS